MDGKAAKIAKLKWFTKRYIYVLILATPFIVIDICMKIIASDVKYYQHSMVIPNLLFNITWIGLMLSIVLNVSRRIGKVLYWVFFSIYFVLFITNGIYYYYTGLFFNFNLLVMANEGGAYILDTIINAKPIVYIMAVIVLLVAIISYKRAFPKDLRKSKPRRLLVLITIFILLHLITPFLMGSMNKELAWDTWRNPRNIYDSFSDVNKSMKICSLYEFGFRDFYMTFLKPEEKDDEDEIRFLEERYSTLTTAQPNEYTGIFKDKNVIFLQLEGMDSWLLNSDDTPNLTNLMSNSLVFNNHYSFYSGGGSTFNSELAVNTGFITPFSYNQNAYTFNNNLFKHSLSNIFNDMGYRVNAFHMNTKEYYSRGINYDNWGYDNYYGLLDENKYKDLSYELDRELILDKDFYERMFCKNQPFLHYIITYTPHTPFTTTKGMGKLLAETVYSASHEALSVSGTAVSSDAVSDDATNISGNAVSDVIYDSNSNATSDDATNISGNAANEHELSNSDSEDSGTDSEFEIPDLSEEETARMYASETDYMIGLLMQALKDNGLYENTVIIAFADHYLYTLNDKTILDKYKNTENNLVNNTPFFIWSNDLQGMTTIDKVNSQIDILPTALNLFGVEYTPEFYIGRDIFDPTYPGYVFFSDYSWYDGNAYVEGGTVTNGATIDENILHQTNNHINDLIKKNDLTLKYDYFRRIPQLKEEETSPPDNSISPSAVSSEAAGS